MKKVILTATAVLAFAGISLSTARAGGHAYVVVQSCLPAAYVCSMPVYCPPPAACRVHVACCPPPRVVVIHNWSPSDYSHSRPQMIAHATPRVAYRDSQHGRW
jgi:hypothetical protein